MAAPDKKKEIKEIMDEAIKARRVMTFSVSECLERLEEEGEEKIREAVGREKKEEVTKEVEKVLKWVDPGKINCFMPKSKEGDFLCTFRKGERRIPEMEWNFSEKFGIPFLIFFNFKKGECVAVLGMHSKKKREKALEITFEVLNWKGKIKITGIRKFDVEVDNSVDSECKELDRAFTKLYVMMEVVTKNLSYEEVRGLIAAEEAVANATRMWKKRPSNELKKVMPR